MIHIKQAFLWMALSSISLLGSSYEFDSPPNITQDEAAIEAAVLTYIESFFLNEEDKMLTVLHPDFHKSGITPREGEKVYERMTMEQLKGMMSRKRALSKERQVNRVKILDQFENTAAVRLETGYPQMRWIEYVQLAKIENKWIITSILWDYYPREEK